MRIERATVMFDSSLLKSINSDPLSAQQSQAATAKIYLETTSSRAVNTLRTDTVPATKDSRNTTSVDTAKTELSSLFFCEFLAPPERKPDAAKKLPEADKTSAGDVSTGFTSLIKSLGAADKSKIDLQELQKGISNPNIKGAEAQMLAIFKARFDKFSALDPPTDPKDKRISLKAIEKFDDLQQQVKLGKNKDADAIAFVQEVEDLMKNMRQVLKDTDRNLYADKAKPVNSIKMECVKQGPIGNCYFYGAVGAVLATNPEALKDLIREEADGTFTVRFPGKKPINVKAPSDAEIFLFPKPGKDGTWMWVLEKAYGQYCMDDHFCQQWRRALGRERTYVPQENTEGPSLFDDGLKFLTGKTIAWTFNVDKDKMIEKLEALSEEKPRRPITADASFNVKVGTGAPVWGHTYSVISYDSKAQSIVLRNPWGSSPPDNAKVKDLGDGKFSMSADDFCKYFNRISYPKKR